MSLWLLRESGFLSGSNFTYIQTIFPLIPKYDHNPFVINKGPQFITERINKKKKVEGKINISSSSPID